MSTYSYTHVRLPEAQRMLDLTSILNDFKRCHLLCDAVFDPTLGSAARDAVFVAIPVVYARPFNGGVRMRVSEIPEQCFTPEQQDLHADILALRSKHVAHSINDLEVQLVRVWLNPVDKGKGVNHVNAENIFALSYFTDDQYRQISMMLAKAIAWVESQLSMEEQSMKSLIEGRFSLDELYASKPGYSAFSDSRSLHRGRSRG